MNNPSMTDVAAALLAIDFPRRFDAGESRLLIRLLRRVAAGSPVPSGEVERIAASIRMRSDVAASFVDELCEHDGEGNIVGVLGLSQKHHPHEFKVNGRILWTWCAWDALFLPTLLGETAEVESVCPATQAKIRVRVATEEIEKIDPPESVITVALPNPDGTRLESSVTIRKTFCCFVHFFGSAEFARKWVLSKGLNVAVLSVRDGFQLGRTVFGRVSEHAGQYRSV